MPTTPAQFRFGEGSAHRNADRALRKTSGKPRSPPPLQAPRQRLCSDIAISGYPLLRLRKSGWSAGPTVAPKG